MSRSMSTLAVALITLVLTWTAGGQSLPGRPTQAALSPTDVHWLKISAGSAATLAVTLDPSASGGDTLDLIVADPAIGVSFVLPSGVEVNSSNASALGFGYSSLAPVSTPGKWSASLLGVGGFHALFQFPSGQVAGSYTIKANGAAITADTAMAIVYVSSSNVRLAVVSDSPMYGPGTPVVLSGIVFDDATPVSGALLTARILQVSDVTSPSLTIGNFTLTGQTAIDADTTAYTYQATLTNTGAAMGDLTATASTTAAAAALTVPELAFSSVGAGSSTPSINTLTIELPSGTTFDPAMVSWTFRTEKQLGTDSLVDKLPTLWRAS